MLKVSLLAASTFKVRRARCDEYLGFSCNDLADGIDFNRATACKGHLIMSETIAHRSLTRGIVDSCSCKKQEIRILELELCWGSRQARKRCDYLHP